MSKINRRPVRRTAAGVLASTLMLSGVVAAGITPANAATGFALDRLEGANRYETSARIATAFGPTTTAILASGEAGRTVDALTANFLAGVQQAPVLLTQRDRVPASVRTVLNTLTGAKNVYIVGGTVAVSAAVETELRTAGFTVTRLAGEDRYATAEAVITAGRAQASPIGLVASGTSFPDALAGGPLAYKGKHPIFLTSGSSIPQDTIDAMVAAGTTRVIILGGTAAVPASVESALAARNITVVTRLGGAGRSETSRLIADYIIANMGFSTNTFNVASGAPRGEGADALSGASLSGKQNRALLITDTQTSAAPVVAFATARANTLNAVGTIFGGTAAVAAALETAIEAAGSATVTNQTFTVTPAETAVLPFGAAAAANTRTYTATVPAGTVVDIQLFESANLTVAANGAVTFADATGTANQADVGAVGNAVISTVNGVANAANSARADGITSTGTITFSVTSTGAATVRPVVFADAADDDILNLTVPTTANNDPKAPSDAFGIGGVTIFTQAEAGLGATNNATIATADVANRFFTNGTNSFFFDANDTFQFGGQPLTLAQFESLLSAGDTITVSYAPDASGVSVFNIITNAGAAAPATPTAVAANVDAGTTVNDVRVTYTRPEANSSGVTYTLQRATVTGGANGVVGTGNDDVTGAFATVTTATQAAGTGTRVFVFTDANLPNGSYAYRVVATAPVTGTTSESGISNVVTIPGTVENIRPTALDTTLTVNGTGGFAGTLDEGDTFVVRFSEVVTVGTAPRLRVRDNDATTNSVVELNTSNATFTLNTAAQTINGTSGAIGTVLTVRVNTAPTVVTAGTTGGIQLPATIIDSAGIADVNGNAWTPAAATGQDVVIETSGTDTDNDESNNAV